MRTEKESSYFILFILRIKMLDVRVCTRLSLLLRHFCLLFSKRGKKFIESLAYSFVRSRTLLACLPTCVQRIYLQLSSFPSRIKNLLILMAMILQERRRRRVSKLKKIFSRKVLFLHTRMMREMHSICRSERRKYLVCFRLFDRFLQTTMYDNS